MQSPSTASFIHSMNPPLELLEKCRDDNRKAHYELYHMCFGFILSVCSRYYINKDDRMAQLNMVFFKMITNMNNYLKKKDTIPFDLWVRKVTVNSIIDEFRKNKKYKENIDLQDAQTEYHYYSDDPINLKISEEAISRAIEKLPEMNRTVFNLYVIDGYKHEEIANLLGISANTSKVHLHRAKNKLKEVLKDVNKSESEFKIVC